MQLHNGIPVDIADAIDESDLELAPGAMQPLRQIDFAKLVAIHDHEEHFLRTTFINTLFTLSRARLSVGTGPAKITADDVKTAIMMLGTAAARQPDPVLSKETRSILKEACPFCD